MVNPAGVFGAISRSTFFVARVRDWEAKMKKVLVIVSVILVGCVAAATVVLQENDHFEKGLEAYTDGDFATAFLELRPSAEEGNVDAQNILGTMYAKGQGVPQDYAEALKWRRLAAAQQNANAQYNLGFMYDKGQGVAQNYGEALKWYRLAAGEGHQFAPNNIAWILATAADAEIRDGEEALRLAQQALESGADPVIIDTLAAAYAEVGLFEKAVREQRRAIDMARSAGELDVVADREGRLKLYRNGRPYRE